MKDVDFESKSEKYILKFCNKYGMANIVNFKYLNEKLIKLALKDNLMYFSILIQNGHIMTNDIMHYVLSKKLIYYYFVDSEKYEEIFSNIFYEKSAKEQKEIFSICKSRLSNNFIKQYKKYRVLI